MRLSFITWLMVVIYYDRPAPELTWKYLFLVGFLTFLYIFSFDTERCDKLDEKIKDIENKIKYLEERIKRK